jgi:hypothetical protein
MRIRVKAGSESASKLNSGLKWSHGGAWPLKKEAWRLKWSRGRRFLQHFDEEQDRDTDTHLCERSDPDPH